MKLHLRLALRLPVGARAARVITQPTKRMHHRSRAHAMLLPHAKTWRLE